MLDYRIKYTCCGFTNVVKVHTPFLELVRIIKYRDLIGEWNIYYCHVVPMGCQRHIFTSFSWFTSKFVGHKFAITKNTDTSVAVFFVPLFGSMFRVFIDLWSIHTHTHTCTRVQIYVCVCVWIWLDVKNLHM